jgi:hypothetical protein
VREAWQEHLPRKPSSCIPSLEDKTARDNGEQSICRRRRPNSLAVSNDSEELFPSLNHPRRTSLLTMRAKAEAREEAEPTWGPSSSCGHAPCQEGSRSSSPYKCPAGGSTDTSSAGADASSSTVRGAWEGRTTNPTKTVPRLRTHLARSHKQDVWGIELRNGPNGRPRPCAVPCRSQAFF